MIQPVGYLQYGYNTFKTSDIKSIERGYIPVPSGKPDSNKPIYEVADKLSKIVRNPDKKDDVIYYSMLCDAAHQDKPQMPVEPLKDRAEIPIRATHIIGQYGEKLAVVPHTLASYEEVICNVAKSLNEQRVVDIVG